MSDYSLSNQIACGEDGAICRSSVERANAGFIHLVLGFFLTIMMFFGLAFEGQAVENQAKENSWHWQVQRVSGRVVVETKQGETLVVKRGMTVRKGWKVKTGKGRIAFSRGKEKFMISPNSVVTLEPKGILVKRTVIF
jgi:hypothetical protein